MKPYFFEYRAYAKGRWMKREILNVFKEEFQDRDEKYYVSQKREGLYMYPGNELTQCLASCH